MYAIGIDKGSYAGKQEPLTLVNDKETADAIKSLLERSNTSKIYVVEVPMWPTLRSDSDE